MSKYQKTSLRGPKLEISRKKGQKLAYFQCSKFHYFDHSDLKNGFSARIFTILESGEYVCFDEDLIKGCSHFQFFLQHPKVGYVWKIAFFWLLRHPNAPHMYFFDTPLIIFYLPYFPSKKNYQKLEAPTSMSLTIVKKLQTPKNR